MSDLGISSSALTEPDITLEESLLVNNLAFAQIFQRIFKKYDRDFPLDEKGGALVSMYDTELDFENQMSDFKDDETIKLSRSSLSSCEDEIEVGRDKERIHKKPRKGSRSMLSGSDGAIDDTDVELVHKMERIGSRIMVFGSDDEIKFDIDMDMIHKMDTTSITNSVVKAKLEVNWDEEERKYHMKKERQAQEERVSSSSEEDGCDRKLNISGQSNSISGWTKKAKRRKRKRSSVDPPRMCDCSCCPSDTEGIAVEGSVCSSDLLISDYVCDWSETENVVLESSYYDSN